jgi:hypothetical protein
MTMTLAVIGYFTVTLAMLIALMRVILQIGRSMADCPQTGAEARGAAMAVATGFMTIGFGGVLIVAAAIPALANPADAADIAMITLLTIGFGSLALGLGFAHAMSNLQDAVKARPVPMEPVLA